MRTEGAPSLAFPSHLLFPPLYFLPHLFNPRSLPRSLPRRHCPVEGLKESYNGVYLLSPFQCTAARPLVPSVFFCLTDFRPSLPFPPSDVRVRLCTRFRLNPSYSFSSPVLSASPVLSLLQRKRASLGWFSTLLCLLSLSLPPFWPPTYPMICRDAHH